MKRIRKFMLLAAVCLSALATPTHVLAESSTWKGEDYSTLLSSGEEFYLYNVGTGRFVAAGGYWGTEAKLLYHDFGHAFTLGNSTSDSGYNILSGQTVVDYENNTVNGVFGINHPEFSNYSDEKWSAQGDKAFGPIINAKETERFQQGVVWKQKYRRTMYFDRIEGETGDTYTYRLREKIINANASLFGKNEETHYLIGGYVGRDIKSDDTNADATTVPISQDQVTFTLQADNFATLSDYYKWRLVPKSEIIRAAQEDNVNNYGGLNFNMSFLVNDPFLTREHDKDFTLTDNKWMVTTTGAAPATNEYRYIWMGNDANALNNLNFDKDNTDVQGYFNKSTQWNQATIHKIQFNTKEYGDYSYALFDGEGIVKQEVTVPVPGYYMVTLNGLSQRGTTEDPIAWLYANGTDGSTAQVAFPVVTGLTQKASYYDSWGSEGADTDNNWVYFDDEDSYKKHETDYDSGDWFTLGGHFSAKVATQWKYATGSWEGLNNVGQLLRTDDYTISVIVYVGENGTLEFGVKKPTAVSQTVQKKIQVRKRGGSTSWSGATETIENYLYDTDIVAFDNLEVVFLGKDKPFLLNEAEEDEQYLDDEFAGTTAGRTANSNVTTYLKRTFTLDEWNSLVLPVSMTAEQLKLYFGEGVKLSVLDGVNSQTDKGVARNCIDFKTVPLTKSQNGIEVNVEGNVVEPGKLYLIKPTKAPGDRYSLTEGTVTKTVEKCYLIGRHDFSIDKVNPQDTYVVNNNTDEAAEKIYYYGTYVKLAKDYGPQQNDYAFSGGKMYHLTDGPMAIKGFRGWLHAFYPTGAKETIFGFDMDNTTTSVDGVVVKPATVKTNNVYTINGQLVRANAQSLDGLAKGIYLMNGKKVIVK